MNTYAKLIVAAAAVLVVAFAGYQFLPRSGGVGGEPTIAPSPSPSLLARGTFSRTGMMSSSMRPEVATDVAGTMSVTHPDGGFTVDLKCARTTEDGVILIGGRHHGLGVPACAEGRARSDRHQAWIAGVISSRRLRGEGWRQH